MQILPASSRPLRRLVLCCGFLLTQPLLIHAVHAASTIESWYQQRQQHVSQSDGRISELIRRAQADDSQAQYELGLAYQSGQGVEANFIQAEQFFRKAAQAGNARAQNALALLLRESGHPQAIAESIDIQQQSAVLGLPEAQYGLGMLYANGQYMPQDLRIARHWLEQAAKRGNQMAALALQELPPPRQPSIRPAQVAAAPVLSPPPVAKTMPRAPTPVVATAEPTATPSLSQSRLSGMSASEIVKAANAGDQYAQLMVGAMYEDGSDGMEQNEVTALAWYLKSAQQGYAKAQHNLALLYEDGRGTEQDYEQAAYWYQQAADGGFSEAQNNLAVLYILGNGVEANRDYAEQLLQQAVAAGNENARRNLNMLQEGAG